MLAWNFSDEDSIKCEDCEEDPQFFYLDIQSGNKSPISALTYVESAAFNENNDTIVAILQKMKQELK